MKRRIIPYNHGLREFAIKNRNEPTPEEGKLWSFLKGRQVLGYDFHRQRPVGQCIVDFICQELELVIEVDGSSHDHRLEEDQARDTWMNGRGLTVLRFRNQEVRENVAGVMKAIVGWIIERRGHTPVLVPPRRTGPDPSQEG